MIHTVASTLMASATAFEAKLLVPVELVPTRIIVSELIAIERFTDARFTK